jgi:hypothetical protein
MLTTLRFYRKVNVTYQKLVYQQGAILTAPPRAAWLRLKQTGLIPGKGQFR